ncbi:hypothetical protein BST63_25215 [Bradyrhizobium canariense]|uniref:Uncharacterized protein n=1 Tax=Bradyrhizobium canariense TaxID=255045 RepID=A0ABX3WYF8_9BRAD|nr:hypothetical protein BSR47_15575 [Bradyrhizobium canariense]OSJ25194.1 hypothetical protein BST63_25215 [Bradyrhizobium canariense]
MPGLVPPARPKPLRRREGPGIHVLRAVWQGVDGRTGPAMTERVVQACRPAKFFTVTPSRSSMISAIIWRWQWVWSRS